MKNAIKIVLLGTAALALVLAVPAALAQQSGQQPPPAQGQQPPAQGQQQTPPAEPAKPPVNPEEEAAYKTFFNLGRTDVEATIQQGEDFLKKYPESKYTEGVTQKLSVAYFSKNNVDKFMEYGERTLTLNPDNVDILPMMALVTPRRIDPSGLGAAEKFIKAEGYARRGIQLLDALQKPATMTQEDFDKARNEKLSMCRSGLGIILYQKQRYAEAAAELDQATKIVASPDPSDLFIMGVAYQSAQRYSDAVPAFERCSQVTWAWQERCKSSLAEAKKQAAAQPPAKKP